MYIEELELKGCKRLTLSQIEYIKVDLSSPFQIFIGTNGSGKSSLLEQLTPLPANPNDFSKGGFKRIIITHLGSRFELISNFDGKGTHSFLKDGVEKNEGHTITVQRNLVEQEFNITEDIHQLLLGRTSFSRLTPTKRREIFTKMSDTDMTYAFNLFKKVATVTRDNQGTVKYIKSRVSKETDKLMSLEIHEDLPSEVERLQKDLNALMTEKTPVDTSSTRLSQEIDNCLQHLHNLGEQLLQLNVRALNANIQATSLEDVVERSYKIESDIHSKRELLSHYSKEHQKLIKIISDNRENGSVSPDELKSKIEAIEKEEVGLKSSIRKFHFQGAVDDLFVQVQDIKSQLVDILSILPDNSDKKFSRTGIEKAEAKILELDKLINQGQGQFNRIEERIRHIDEAKETNCPQCGYVWKDGVSERDREGLVKQRVNIETSIDELRERLKKWQTYRESIQEYSALYSRYRNVVNSYPKAKNLFDYLMEDERIFHQPSQHIQIVNTWVSDLTIAQKLWSLYQEKSILTETLKKIESIANSGVDINHSQTALNDLEDQVEKLTYEIKVLGSDKKDIDLLINSAKRSQSLYEEINDLLSRLTDLQSKQVDTLRSEKLGEAIGIYQNQLATKSNKLREKQAIENIIQDLTINLDDVEKQYAINKLLTKALSPTDGVIAKQMTAFINCVIDQMNDILGQLYTYPIEVQPCGIESNDLDFKFPFKAGHIKDQKPRKDVSEGSEGQQEVIDFTFRLVAMLYLNFNDYPLYIDEVGRAQDEQHLTNLMNYIKLLIESNRHSQLFMISHIAAGFGIFNKADVTVLSSSNVTVPSRYNEHVVIE